MDAKDFAQELRGIVADLKTKGVEPVRSDNLVQYLDEAVDDLKTSAARPSAATIESYQAELQKGSKSTRTYARTRVEMFRSVIQATSQRAE